MLPGSNEKNILIAILAFMAGVMLCVIVFSIDTGSELAPTLTTLVAAFGGAWAAFHLADRKDLRKNDELNAGNIRHALYIIAMHVNESEILLRHCRKFPTSRDAAFFVPPLAVQASDHLDHDFKALSFLANTEYVQLLFELSAKQIQFKSAMYAVQLRTEYYVSSVMPALKDVRLRDTPVSANDIEDALGKSIYTTSIDYFSQMHERLDMMKKEGIEIHEKLLSAGIKLFPNETFFGIEL